MFIPEKRLENFGLVHEPGAEEAIEKGPIARFLHWIGYFAFHHAKGVVAAAVLLLAVAAYGIANIEINDNPTKWFKQSHPIRVADKVLNEHFGGTYMAYLVLRAPGESAETALAGTSQPEAEETPDAPALPAAWGRCRAALPAATLGCAGGRSSACSGGGFRKTGNLQGS